MTKGLLIILSGLPGSGKSTIAQGMARMTGAMHLRIDTVEQGLRDICGLEKLEGEGYRLSYRIAQDNLRLGVSVIADSVNPWPLTRDEWNRVATEIGAPFVNIEVLCSDQIEHRSRVETRGPSVPGLAPPTWEAVQARDYRAWISDRDALDTAGKTIDQCVDEACSFMSKRHS